ncbi:hypothetical protein PPTG_21484 [Phytophthora nicotianae INRA-310]|uniref:Uncharacterized protein n=2 Tax=Phytophthora nicotianae TaxID=4792 RepID=W2R4M1_PHYN3|nr:hypothetical protein PPTG_21484 [Phytophthora nicotianae INRA-310]ETN19674.1 hypothetical protein PPTG_21484 [Phytophthora nicotianae INRA-310]ETO67064.1 hypothetical protein F444_15878 [Phytophthora nicotianae P1976]
MEQVIAFNTYESVEALIRNAHKWLFQRPACPLDARPMVSAMAFAIEHAPLAVSTFLVAFG